MKEEEGGRAVDPPQTPPTPPPSMAPYIWVILLKTGPKRVPLSR